MPAPVQFMGLDGFVWFVGVVEDRLNDPSKLGRVRVRCLGYHTEDKNLLPTEDLPWAHVMHPVTDPSMQGMGNTPSFLVEGSWVMGFFMDADMKQQPVIMGSLPGAPNDEGTTEVGFNDPNRRSDDPNSFDYYTSVYPQSSRGQDVSTAKSGHDLYESDTNRLARNDKATSNNFDNFVEGTPINQHTMLADKAKDQANYTYIPVAGGAPFAQPTSSYDAEYPKNHVYESESGHIREYDDTSKKERIHEYHRTGTFYEIDGGGNRTIKIVGDGYHIVAGSDYAYVGGTVNLTVESNCNTYVKGNYNLQVDGDMEVLVKGNKKETILCEGLTTGSVTQIIKNGTKTVSVDGAVSEIYGSTLTTSVKDKVTQTFVQGLQTNITGAYDLDVGTNPNDSDIIGSIVINTPTFDIDSVTSIAMDSASINLNQGTKGAARVDDPADTGDAGAGGHFDVNSAGTDKIESGSTTVFIGTTAPTITEPTLLEATDNLTIDEDPVATVKTAYGLDSLDIDKTYAAAIISGRKAEVAAGFDPDTFEGMEVTGLNGVGGPATNRKIEEQTYILRKLEETLKSLGVDIERNAEYQKESAKLDKEKSGQVGAIKTEAAENPGLTDDQLAKNYSGQSGFKPYTSVNGYNKDGRLKFLSHTDPRISPILGQALEDLAKAYGTTLTITSAYRSPAYNKLKKGAKKSAHMKGLACDILMPNTTKAQRLDFVEKASESGIKGIGLYFPSEEGANFIHLDIGEKRQWATGGSRTNQYGWANPTFKRLGYLIYDPQKLY